MTEILDNNKLFFVIDDDKCQMFANDADSMVRRPQRHLVCIMCYTKEKQAEVKCGIHGNHIIVSTKDTCMEIGLHQFMACKSNLTT